MRLGKFISSKLSQEKMILVSSTLTLRNPLEFWYNNHMLGKNKSTRIMVFGTFDGLHRGHLDFFKQARKLAKKCFLIVSIARNSNVFKIKGSYPVFDEKKRMDLIKRLIKKHKLVDKVVLSGIKNYIPHIIRECPDIIALGYDQKAYVKNLKKDLKNKGMLIKIVRLNPYKENFFKNNLLKRKR